MTDKLSKKQRSVNMSRIGSKDTKPELFVRSILHRSGFRFRNNIKDLPGKPDIVLPKYRIVIFVNGCFWHRHKNCKYTTTPKTNRAFWKMKFKNNILNDKLNRNKLKRLGLKVITVWGCQIRNPDRLIRRLVKSISAHKC